LARDPRDALAWVGLAETYSARAGHSSQMPLQEGYERARDAVGHALGLDPALAAAYATLCDIQSTYDWVKAADDSIQRALQLAPRFARPDEGGQSRHDHGAPGPRRRPLSRAIELDPLRAGLQYNLARIHLARGQVADAERFARRAVGYRQREASTS
jgi:Tfp pilus assembly protein PilF